jgi:hypothetical protein
VAVVIWISFRVFYSHLLVYTSGFVSVPCCSYYSGSVV